MKKNLLTLVFVFSVMFFGILVNNAEASSKTSLAKNQQIVSKSSNHLKRSEFNTKFNLKLKKLCGTTLIDPCTAQLIAYSVWSDWAFSVCDSLGLNSTGCSMAQALAFYQLDFANSTCANQNGIVVKRKEQIQTHEYQKDLIVTATSRD